MWVYAARLQVLRCCGDLTERCKHQPDGAGGPSIRHALQPQLPAAHSCSFADFSNLSRSKRNFSWCNDYTGFTHGMITPWV